jgi:signal transduction histidine kinase
VLHQFIATNQDEIIRRCRAKVAMRSTPPPTRAEIDHGVPLFLNQLIKALRAGSSSPEIGASSIQHGHDLLMQGFTVSQVVHDYGDVCQSITELAGETNAVIRSDDFRMLNQCLDEAIAGAVTEYGRERNQTTLDGETARGNETLGFLTHELRNLTNTAIMAFEVLKTGNVGVSGSTGTVLHRSLMGLRTLISRSLAEIRLSQTVQDRSQFPISGLIADLGSSAALEAHAKGVALIVMPVAEDIMVEADRQVLSAVVTNLLQNAFKFTRSGTNVILRVGASAERVLIEVEDECGGLPDGSVAELFRPFEQRGGDRSGVGLGLAFSRWGAEANYGRIYARNLPDKGCVFTVDLPRLPVAAAALV